MRMVPIEAHIFEGLVPRWWTYLGWLGRTIMMEEVCGWGVGGIMVSKAFSRPHLYLCLRFVD